MKDETVIAAIFSSDRKEILLVKRRDVPVWVLPGGGIDSEETIPNACIREAREETGFQVNILKKVGEYTPICKLARFTHLYECTVTGGTTKLSDECKEVAFFPLTDLPKEIPPPHDEWILEAHKNEEKLIQRRLTSVNYLNLLKNFFLHPILVIRFILSKIGLTLNT